MRQVDPVTMASGPVRHDGSRPKHGASSTLRLLAGARELAPGGADADRDKGLRALATFEAATVLARGLANIETFRRATTRLA